MLTSKQRAWLRGIGSRAETIVHIGKGGVTDTVVQQVEETLLAREMLKGKVLENAPLTAREACDILAERCKAEPVQVIGSKFVLYRENPKISPDKRIKLPKR